MWDFLEWRVVKLTELVFAVIGVILTAYGIWIGFFADERGISAAYKVEVLAQRSDAFPTSAFLQNGLSSNNRVVQLDVLVWNSGKQIIKREDVRSSDHDLLIQLDIGNLSSLVPKGWKLVKQESSIDNNYDLQSVGGNNFKLSWQAFDPGNFVQLSFLIATNLDKAQFDDIKPKFIASVTGTRGNVTVNSRSYSSFQTEQGLIGVPVSGVVFLFAMIAFTNWIPKRTKWVDNLSGVPKLITAVVILIGGIGTMFFIALTAGVFAAHFFANVPEWTNVPLLKLLSVFESSGRP